MPLHSPPGAIADLTSRRARPAQRPKIIVVSHERSGTHFLMNALGRAYGYPATQFLNFDNGSLDINYFDPPAVAHSLGSVLNGLLVKSHHPVDFFEGVLDQALRSAVILYIHRDPVDVMISFWRFIQRWRWHERAADG